MNYLAYKKIKIHFFHPTWSGVKFLAVPWDFYSNWFINNFK